MELSAKKKELTEDFNVGESSAKSMLRDEFLINMQKFASSISRTIQQIEGEVKLECPDLPGMTDSMESNLNNEPLREQVCTLYAETQWLVCLHSSVLNLQFYNEYICCE